MSQTEKKVFQLIIRGLKNDKYVFNNKMYEDSEEIVNTRQNHELNLKRYPSKKMNF